MPAEVGGEAGEKLHFHWLKGLFEGATAALTRGLDSLCAFIGIKARRTPSGTPCKDNTMSERTVAGRPHATAALTRGLDSL